MTPVSALYSSLPLERRSHHNQSHRFDCNPWQPVWPCTCPPFLLESATLYTPICTQQHACQLVMALVPMYIFFKAWSSSCMALSNLGSCFATCQFLGIDTECN